ncbi:MAG: histidine--tRNA ligase [Candidatus Micrarchaeia archaeon]
MVNLQLPRGTRDLMPNEAIFRNELLKRLEKVIQRFGFTTIDTPSFELLRILYAKNAIGEDTKLIYELKDEELGLRYDNTVSLARFISMHPEMPLPFKRYYIGKAWRREEPQHLRYREFTQIDADIIGGSEVNADAEIIALGCKLFDELGINYKVQLSDRRIIGEVFKKLGIAEELHINVMRAIDKLDKLSSEEVIKILSDLKLSSEVIDALIDFITHKGSNEDKLVYAEGLIGNKQLTDSMRSVLELLDIYRPKGRIEIEYSTMRGFDYYTGRVFEFKTEELKETLCGGGRYDNLIKIYSNREVPAVGFAVGLDRLLDYLSFSDSLKLTYANVFVACVKDSNHKYGIKVANKLRSMGIPTDIDTSEKNLSNQLKYANSLKIPYVIIVGDEEEKQEKVKFRNLTTGSEVLVGIDEVPKLMKW